MSNRDADLTSTNAVDLFRTIALRKRKETDWCNPHEFVEEKREESCPLRLTAMSEENAAKCDAREDARVVLDAYICNLLKLSLKRGRKGCSRLPLPRGSMRINESPS